MKKNDFLFRLLVLGFLFNLTVLSAKDYNYEFFYTFDQAVADTITGVKTTSGTVNAKVYPSSNANNNVAFIDVDGNMMASYSSANIVKEDVSYIQTDSLTANSTSSDATYGMWVKMKDPMDGRPLQILMSTIGARALLQVRPVAGKWRVETAVNTAPGRFDASLSLEFGVWAHVAMVTKTSPAAIEIYVNGELATLTAASGATLDSGFMPFTNIRIGAHNNLSGGQGQTFCGEMDEVFMAKEALTQAQIKEVMGSAPGQNEKNTGGELVKSSFFYDFTGADLETGVKTLHGTTDAVCTAIDGLASNLSFIADDKRGTVVSFPKENNVQDSVSYIQTDGLTSGSYNCDASYGMWINLADPEDSRPIQTILTTTGARALLQLRAVNNTWTLETAVNVAPGRFATTDTIPYGKWTHIALVTEKEPASMKMYINGAEVSTQANDGASLSNGFEKFYELRVGAHNNQSEIGCLQSFCGLMDDVFMYSKAFSAAQIDSLVKASSPSTALRSKLNTSVKLYPNPIASGEVLTIEGLAVMSQAQVKIYDLTGTMILSQRVENGTTQIQLPQQLVRGQYFVRIKDKQMVYTQKVMVY